MKSVIFIVFAMIFVDLFPAGLREIIKQFSGAYKSKLG
tara:strand:+ start:140 stop:253 length:114 start_codon:yes stop_codon:yes gene_type:complete